MKILDITEFYSERGGGIRSHLTTRGHVLCQLGHDHAVIAPGPRDDDAAAPNASDAPAAKGGRAGRVARVIRVAGPSLPYDRTYHLLGRFGKIRSLALAYAPDVLEAHSPYLATAAVLACGRAAARARTAFWHSDHVGTYVQPALAKRMGEATAEALARPLWRGVRALLAPFDATFVAGVAQEARLRAAGVPNVIRAPFGVDTRTFSPSTRRNERRRELLAGDDGPLFVGVGRFAVEKRWDVVLEAFGRVRARNGGTLVLYGDGPERERLRAAAPPGVRFAGFETSRARLASALASADVLIHGCPYETFGIGVAEAVACGLPVVAPDAGGAAESVDASCGETYRSLDAGACAEAVERILARDPVELRQCALRAASRVPTLEQHFKLVVATYDELLRRASQRLR